MDCFIKHYCASFSYNTFFLFQLLNRCQLCHHAVQELASLVRTNKTLRKLDLSGEYETKHGPFCNNLLYYKHYILAHKCLASWLTIPGQFTLVLTVWNNMEQWPASVAQLDAPSDWRPGGRGFNPRRGRQHSFVEIDHEIFSTVILSLPLIQEGQLSVSGERMCTILVNRLED